MASINSVIMKVKKKLKSILINYDLVYLRNKMNKKNIKTIVVGSSYSLFGIIESNIDSCVNMSLPSQDIYYSSKIIYDLVNKNKNINKIVMSLSYYSLYFDLSSSKNERSRINRVYYPIFKDSHNYVIKKSVLLPVKEYFWNIFTNNVNKDYFSDVLTRQVVCGYWENKDFIDNNKKKLHAEERASHHNKLLKYKKTLNENMQILRELIIFTNLNKIELSIVVFPVSSFYSSHLDKRFKEQFYKFFKSISDSGYNIKLIDMFTSNEINEDKDIIDYDHLSESGALKITEILNRLINF